MKIFLTALTGIALLSGCAGNSQPGSIQRKAIAPAKAAEQQGRYEKAVALYRPLAEGGAVMAQLALGKLHLNGLGVPPSETEAARWFQACSDIGYSKCYKPLAQLYEQGSAGVRDDSKALAAYRKAAADGDVKAHMKVAQFLIEGNGTARDPNGAIEHYQHAAASGDVRA